MSIGLFVAALALAAAYRIARIGLAENFARSDPAEALRWSAGHPLALRARAHQLRKSAGHDSRDVEALARRSLETDPVDGRSFGVLGLEAASAGRDVEADKLLGIGVRRAPRDFDLRVAAMASSLRGNRFDEATRHVVAILQVNPDYPYRGVEWLWHIYLGSPEGKESVVRLALAPNDWRQTFLRHVATNSADPAEVLALLGDMQRRKVPAAARERDVVFEALVARHAWRPAFALWVQDPALGKLRRLPNVFNGDFEREFSGRPGFDWQLTDAGRNRAVVEPGPAGGKSLRIDLLGREGTDALIRHPLLLGPGRYTLSARVRSEGSRTRRAPQLVLTCVDPGAALVKTLELDMGATGNAETAWRSRSVLAEIPADCLAQVLELKPPAIDFSVEPGHGSFWVDDIALVRWRGAPAGLAAGAASDMRTKPPAGEMPAADPERAVESEAAMVPAQLQ